MQALGAATPTRGRPRSTPNYRFGFVLPASRRGFFDMIDRVVAQAAGDFRHQHITEITHRLPNQDGADFAAELAKMTDLDGIALLAPDVPQVKLAINELVRAGVHVVTLFSDVPGSLRKTCGGAHTRPPGRTAGTLMGRCLPRGEPGRCAMLSPPTRFAAEIDRRIGFAQVLEERFPDARLIELPDMPESEDEAYAFARQYLDPAHTGGKLHALYNIGPGSHGVSRALQEFGYDSSLGFVVHDLLEMHRSLLVANVVSYVLQQDVHYAIMTAAKVLRLLCEEVRGALAVSNPRIEIITAENLA
jgi:LacI family transcriptional regulator